MEAAETYITRRKSELWEPFRCRECGHEVVWAYSTKTGKTYLARIKRWMSDFDESDNGNRNRRTFYPFHDCTPDADYQERYRNAMEFLAKKHADLIANGEIVKGQKVRVFKGRKIPVGTIGVIFWIASEPGRFDVVKAGIETETGEKIWINIAHLEAVK